MGLVRPVAAILFILAIPIALITTNVRVAMNEPRLYEYAADEYDTARTTGIPRAELLRASGELRDYFNNSEDEVSIRVRGEEGDFMPLFNRREVLHLRDVKTLFRASFHVQEGAVLFVLAYVVAVFIWARESSLRTLAIQVLIAGAVGLTIFGAVAAFAATGFDQAFDQFHEIAFTNDYWRLDPSSDHLIQMFPEGFWEDVSLWVGVATLAELGGLMLISAAYLGLTRGSSLHYAAAQGAGP